MSDCAHLLYTHVTFRQEVSPTEIQSIKAENQILKDRIKEQETRIISL